MFKSPKKCEQNGSSDVRAGVVESIAKVVGNVQIQLFVKAALWD